MTDPFSQPDPHLLIVDDDERIRSLLARYLRNNGFLVTTAGDAAHARRILAGLDFDLLVLDVMMPGESGIELTRALRTGRNMPILMLTARGESGDRIEGLEAGADDYLAKPFEPKELLLRINAILRRVPDVPADASGIPGALRLGALRWEVERGELWHGDEAVHLTGTEAQLMRVFAGRPGRPLARSELTEELGRSGGDAIQERAVDVQITRLRRKIEADPKQPRYLQTVRGAGYMLVPD
ncbi:two-component system phosphate regulon response regulator OmpR [Hasllibacter halocynthiae]|uniref:Two-component system phosphate regulon response regulator OmpR n=1 Tax=Hasllibacter halocynthiae TaxID=595589 RepID=A0A2T0X344_9RHOB|nr:response regulator [Hasllibacter halocynthiae]PRY93373.1 two-component system phosphate regulon response regulator OmpR [Hasllibacter halocynthiae]